MEYDGVIGARLSAIEQRLGAIEQRLAELEQGSATVPVTPKRHRRELTLEERQAVRARLVAGKEKKQREKEAQIRAEAQGSSPDNTEITKKQPRANRKGKKEAQL